MNPLNASLIAPLTERLVPEIKTNVSSEIANNNNDKIDSYVVDKKQENTSEDALSKSEFFADLQQNLQKLNEVFPLTTTNLSFEFDKAGSESFIRVIDRDNQKVIREIPSEEFRKVAKALDEFADNFRTKGLIFDRTA